MVNNIKINQYPYDDLSDSDIDIIFEDSSSESESEVSSDSEELLVINIYGTDHALFDHIKHVRFNNNIVTHIIEIEDRKGYWTEDIIRFQRRCASVQDAISFIFDEVHRRKMRLIVNISDNMRKNGGVTSYLLKNTCMLSLSNISYMTRKQIDSYPITC
jgi:hypothetical protein